MASSPNGLQRIGKRRVLVYQGDSEISVRVEDPAKRIGLENGSTTSHEKYKVIRFQ